MKISEKRANLLVEQSRHHAYFATRQFIKDDATIEDILQESYIKAFKNLDTLDNIDHFNKWFYRIVVNTCKDKLKKTKEFSFSDIATEENAMIDIEDRITKSPEEALHYKGTSEIITSIMNELPFEQSLCLFLFYYEEWSIKEIADYLEVKEATVKSRLRYGKLGVGKRVEEYQNEHGIKLYSTAVVPLLVYSWFQLEQGITIPKSFMLSPKTMGLKLTKITTVQKIILTAIAVAGIGFGSFFLFFQRQDEEIMLKNSSYIIEFGETISDEATFYLTNTDEELLKEVSVGYEKGEDELITIGTYTVTITYRNQQKECNVEVKDTIPPVFVRDEETLEFEAESEIDLLSYYEAEDLSEVELELQQGAFDINVPGEYIIKIIAKDTSGNQVDKETKIIVNKKEIEEEAKESVVNNNNTGKNNSSNQPATTPQTPTPSTQTASYDRSNPIVAAALDRVGGKDICSGVAEYAIRAIGKTAWITEVTPMEGGGEMTMSTLSPENFLKIGTPIALSSVHPGDIVYYADGGYGSSHVAVYIGNGMCVHGGWGSSQDIVIYSMNVGSGLKAVRIK